MGKRENRMFALIGFVMIGGFIVAVVGLIMLIVAAAKKHPKKKSVIILLVGLVLSIGAPVSAAVLGLQEPVDYTVTTKAEGKDFLDQLDSDTIKDQTLKFKVTDIGSNGPLIAFQAPGEFNVMVPASKASKAVKVGDTITVTCKSAGNVFGLPMVTGTLDE